MSYHRHNHGAFGILALIAAIYFAFGERTARTAVQFVLLAGLAFFVYIGWRVVMGTI